MAVTVPFMLLAVRRKGWTFTLRSVLAVALVSALSQLHPHLLAVTHVAPLYGVVVGNLALGLAILILFRHGSSLGGFNVVALRRSGAPWLARRLRPARARRRRRGGVRAGDARQARCSTPRSVPSSSTWCSP